jgi:hypothetical protein
MDKYFPRYLELKWPKNSISENMSGRKNSFWEQIRGCDVIWGTEVNCKY